MSGPPTVHRRGEKVGHPQVPLAPQRRLMVLTDARGMIKTPPPHPFIRSELPDLDVRPSDLRAWSRSGAVHSVFHGAWMPDGLTDTIEMRVRLASRLLPAGHVVSGRTAAWLY